MSVTDKLLAGMIEEEEDDHPGTLKIDGISNSADDGSSWHIKCHVCDSVLLVSDQQVGSQVKCNDCYSMLSVKPREKTLDLEDGVRDGSDLEVIKDNVSVSLRDHRSDDSDELTLMPELKLAPEVTEAQKETRLDDAVIEEPLAELTEEHLDEDAEEEDDEPILLMEPVSIAKTVSPMFGLTAPDGADDDDEDDSDEMIEMLDVSPDELNAPEPPLEAPSAATQLPRMPRKGKKQAPSIPVENGEETEAPIRVHAKRRRKKPTAEPQNRPPVKSRFAFEKASFSEVLDKAVGVLKSANIWIWSLVAIGLMAIGSAVWQWVRTDLAEPDTYSFAENLLGWGVGLFCGQAVFFIGYIILLFVGGVIFRETAQGKTKVDSISVTDSADFTSTMLLFGFSMFIAALPCMFFGYMFISIPFQFFFAGALLFAAWKNQGAFSIVSGSLLNSISQNSASWKNWLLGAGLASLGGIVGGGLMEVPMQIISVFTSIAGAIIIAFATLLYAAITGWHCGSAVESLQESD
jgi:DNA-directed RNA polymerase subunit RPC12/RpoP